MRTRSPIIIDSPTLSGEDAAEGSHGQACKATENEYYLNRTDTGVGSSSRTSHEPHTNPERNEMPSDLIPTRVEKVTFLKLTHQSVAITEAILYDPGLRKARNRMERHGCSVSPGWANGGLLFFPYNVEDLEENGHALDFQREHIVIANKDLSALATALLTVAEEERPSIWLEEDRDMADMLLDSEPENEPNKQQKESAEDWRAI
jgi:hypothetical protein